MSHYNTTKESGKQLEIFEQTAKNQEHQILKIMELYKRLSPSDVWKWYGKSIPLTSVRRALTNLSNQGKLIKTDEKKKGIYGREEYVWSVPIC